jgi:hypothetical protein
MEAFGMRETESSPLICSFSRAILGYLRSAMRTFFPRRSPTYQALGRTRRTALSKRQAEEPLEGNPCKATHPN